ncbi:hypothetical protein LCGC14_1429890 [marine sediment metagenome]|uniref:Portal protein n=1 Tax=marine sediment metagenome TaxID=412755 RepID=A0A0F9JP73_9ZZZZ
MIGVIQRDKGELKLNEKSEALTPLSAYNPPDDVRDLTERIQQDNQVGYDLQNRPFTEFNDSSLLQRADIDQKRWNAYRIPQSDNVDEAWRWNGIRPITRNRILGIVAQMTSQIVMPAPFAQNDKDELDVSAALVMRDLMEFNIRNSSYVEDYIMWITDALVNPVAYLGVGFLEVMQTVKDENEGKISKKEIIDSVLSGFQTFNIPIDEVLISNFYQKDLNRQRFVIRRRYIDYDEAKAIAGEHDNFEFVKPGLRTVFDHETSLFYDVYDQNLQTLVEEITYYNRQEDIEVPYMNGIYVGDDDVEANPIKHRDNENRPKYNFAPLGYEDISPRFFYYKSAAWKLGDDDELVVRTEQLLADAVFLATMPPTITAGHGQMSEAIVIPGKNTAFENPNVSVTPIQLGSQLSQAFNLLLKKEKDASEDTLDPQSTGVQAGTQKTAREAALLAENAKISLGRFGNMLVTSLKNIGGLMIDVIIQHQTVMDVEETISGELKESFKTFILTDVEEGDKKVTHKIMFNQDSEEGEPMSRSLSVLNKEGGIDSDTRIYEVNPVAWRKLKYHLVMDVQELIPPVIKEIQQAGQEQLQREIQQTPARQKVGSQKVKSVV